MTRLVWMAAVVLGCQGQPVLEVSLGGAPFEVKDAVFYSTVSAFGQPSTFVVFGDRSELCGAFEDDQNLCNANIVPDVHDGVTGALARPVGGAQTLGWLMLRSGIEGPALVVPDQLGLATPGASLTRGAEPAVRSTKNRVVLEHVVAGASATVSFESELTDGRPFRGRVEASWCPALDMVRRHNESLRGPVGVSSSAVPPDYVSVAQCGAESISAKCRENADGSEECTCLRAGATSTCRATPDPRRSHPSCCNLRFGD